MIINTDGFCGHIPIFGFFIRASNSRERGIFEGRSSAYKQKGNK